MTLPFPARRTSMGDRWLPFKSESKEKANCSKGEPVRGTQPLWNFRIRGFQKWQEFCNHILYSKITHRIEWTCGIRGKKDAEVLGYFVAINSWMSQNKDNPCGFYFQMCSCSLGNAHFHGEFCTFSLNMLFPCADFHHFLAIYLLRKQSTKIWSNKLSHLLPKIPREFFLRTSLPNLSTQG